MARQKSKSKFIKNYQYFTYLAKLPPKQQKDMMNRTTDKEIWASFAEICYNLLRNHVTLTDAEKRLLRPYKQQIYEISLKSNSIAKKKKAVQANIL